MVEWAMIHAHKKTVERLRKHRKVTEDFDDVLIKLLDYWEQRQKNS